MNNYIAHTGHNCRPFVCVYSSRTQLRNREQSTSSFTSMYVYVRMYIVLLPGLLVSVTVLLALVFSEIVLLADMHRQLVFFGSLM